MNNIRKTIFTILLAFVLIFLAGCKQEENPTEDASATRAYQTVNALLTQAVTLTPLASATTLSSTTPIGNQTPTQTPTTAITVPTLPATTAAPVSSCDMAAAGNPIDVTIPDDTEMQPGQAFTKTWRLVNSGTCTWTTTYKVALFSGDTMGAQASIALPKDVAPGETIDISVDMIAPLEAGSYQGNWKLRNEADQWFGIGAGEGSVFWVRIVVVGSSTVTATNTTPQATNTNAPTATSVPVQVSGSATLNIGDGINLSSNIVNSGANDAIFQKENEEPLKLVPQGSAQFGIYGASQPNYANCQATALSSSPMVAGQQLTQGSYLCYRTNQGLLGWLRIASFNTESGVLKIQLLTWAIP
jgi:hypothetical protein